VPVDLAGERADRVVVAVCARAGRRVTRAEVQRWMGEGRVTRAGRPLSASTRLEGGARLRIEPAPPPPSDARPDASVRFAVVFEDAHLVVVDKPAGLVVHPARGHREATLVHGLLARGVLAAADPRDATGRERPGIVHRLDKGTSGLMVVAKHAEAREGLKALFQRHDIERAYLALVVGDARAARYDTPHGRHPKSRLRFTSLLGAERPGVRRAVTRVEPLARYAGATLVRCLLETGRTHQIRVHLAEQARTPVLGDPLYGRPPADPALRRIAETLGRQALHAALLGLVHPVTGERHRWQSPLPDDIEQALAALGPPLTRPSI
jgi:23S rRNA pseudouridine1911/1915/1917 synthase